MKLLSFAILLLGFLLNSADSELATTNQTDRDLEEQVTTSGFLLNSTNSELHTNQTDGDLSELHTNQTDGDLEEEVTSDDCTYNITKMSSGLSKNGTLKPSDQCVWNIFGNDSLSGSSGLLFEKVHLDILDTLTITDVNGTVLFGPYNGTLGPLAIAVDEKNFTVKLSLSSNKKTRTFDALYSGNCIFSVPPSIAIIESPIYKIKPKQIHCVYDFNKITEDVSHSFIFTNFSLDSESSLDISEADGPNGVFKTTPPDIIGPKARFNLTLNMNSTGNSFTIVRRDLYHSCTKYMEVPATPLAMLQSPPAMTSYNDTVNFECRWLIQTNEPNTVLGLFIDKLQFSNIFDMLVINDGPSELSHTLVQATFLNQEETKVRTIRTSEQYLWISFKSEAFASSFTANSTKEKGGYYNGSGTITSQSDAVFLLEVDTSENVLLNFSSSEFASPATLNIYDGFSTTSTLIAELHGNVWYPVISSTSKMMVVAKNFDASKTFTAHFSGFKSGCVHMSASSNDAYVVSGNCNMTCAWVVPPKNVSNEVVVLEFHILSLDVNDVIEVFRLSNNQAPVATISYSTKHVPPLSFDSREGFYMNVSRGICKSGDVALVAHSTYLPGCSRNFSLVPSSEIQLSTLDYPNQYPLFAECEWNLITSGNTTQFYLAFQNINLAPGHCIQINHTTGGIAKTEVIDSYKLPSDMLYENVMIHFDSFNCNKPSEVVPLVSGEGFVLNVTSSDCGSIMTAKTDQFNTSLAVSKGKNSCFWVIQVPHNESDGSVNSVMFTVEVKEVKNNNSEFRIHDGSSVRDHLMTNYTGNIWSYRNTVTFVYKRFNASLPSDVYTINYKTINCNKAMQCANGICLHPDWRCNGVNDCGDFTDERDCGTVPVPKPEKQTNKVSAVTFGVVTVIFFILGALVAFLIPKAINRYRSGRYHQFQDYSNVD